MKSERDLRIAVYRQGVEPSLRRTVWKHLLNVFPEGFSSNERIDYIRSHCHKYREMRDLWMENTSTDVVVVELSNMVRKDVLRTDRYHKFYASTKQTLDVDNNDLNDNTNVASMFNILMTYALNHKNRYCQGMSDLVSPLLYVMKDEAHCYISFCALMTRLTDNFSTEGIAIGRKFDNLKSLLQHYDSDFYSYLVLNGADDLLFCYRWLLLDLKREFPFDDALEVFEVLWASIPPKESPSANLNLFDEDFLYVPGPSKEISFPSGDSGKKKSSFTGTNSANRYSETTGDMKILSLTASTKQMRNHQARSIKFMPNVLSSDSQNLDSPNSDFESIGQTINNHLARASYQCDNYVPAMQCNPWDSPEISTHRKKFEFHPSSFSKLNFRYASDDFSLSYDKEINEPLMEQDNSLFDVVGCTNKTENDFPSMKSKPNCDDASSIDSGIPRSNTFSSVQSKSVVFCFVFN